MITTDKYGWYEEENRETIFAPEQLMIAVYRGERSEIVVRQKEDPYMDEGDTIIFLTPDNALRVGQELIRLASEMGAFGRKGDALQSPAPPARLQSEPGPLLQVMERGPANDGSVSVAAE